MESRVKSEKKITHSAGIRLLKDLAGAILAGLLAVLFINRGVLLHHADVSDAEASAILMEKEAAENNGAGALDASDTVLPKGMWEATDANSSTVIRPDGSVTVSFSGFPVSVYIKRLAVELEALRERPTRLDIEVTRMVSGSPVTRVYGDFQPIYLGTEVLDLDAENILSVSLRPAEQQNAAADLSATPEEPLFRTGAILVDNRFLWDPYVFMFALFSVFALLVMVDFRKRMTAHPEFAFLLIALTMGISMTAGLPRNKVGYDEETHLQAVMDMASFPSSELHVSDAMLNQLLITEYNHPDAQPQGMTEMAEWDDKLGALADYKQGAHTPDFYTMPNRMPAYLAMAAAMKIGKGLNLPWPMLLLVTRLANLVMYACVMALAIRICPRGKYLMMLIGLFPVNLFLDCTVSYDPFITAFLSMGYAFLLKSRKYVVPALICIFVGCLAKAVYAPVALLALIWLGRHENDDAWHPDTKDWLLLFGCGVVFILLIGTFILPTVMAPAETGDVRGGEAVSEVSQVGFILGNPLRYAWILVRQIFRWIPQCWFGADCTTHMGHLVNGTTAFKGYYPAYLIMLVVTIVASWFNEKGHFGVTGTEDEIIRKLQIPQRVWTFLMVGAASALIWTSMYVAFTEPGAEEIGGVQGRYFIPLMFPLYMVLSGPLETKPSLWYYLLELAELIMLALTVWTTVISRFCL